MPAGWQGFGWFRLWVKKQDLSLTDSWDLFNGSVLVARHGKLVYEKQLGLANKEFGIPISEHTKFEMASLAKPFTALLILQLVQNGAEFKRQADYDPKLPSFY